ncbi:hypothetical protein AJ80_05496 [Polytolypa hystricis UAMH7299]|uniref:Chromosome transmission fidelity protein 4 n=1 Tax=Polytolypa hystricis (strain UAMH7299) TaxID=1447883 RepID=A0A2B7Y2W3_POLH7|nr:hypothetical protein AJ80_05496 [Polytolypa hystricis UAMH7299]
MPNPSFLSAQPASACRSINSTRNLLSRRHGHGLVRRPRPVCAHAVRYYHPSRSPVSIPRRSLAHLRPDPSAEICPASPLTRISASDPRALYGRPDNLNDHKPPDERILKLGKTLRILSSHLPNLLVHPLPQEILSPSISLHLFPSTHPHLPTVKGQLPYRAALWTAPVAWGSVPIVGNVKLRILSERMVRAPSVVDYGHYDAYGDEKLVVRWRTEGGGPDSGTSSRSTGGGKASGTNSSIKGNAGTTAGSSSTDNTNRGLSALLGGDAPIFNIGKEEQFSGLFIFSFDEEGRIASHTIEHADQSHGWDRTAKFVTLTDWLIGRAKRAGGSSAGPAPALTSGLHAGGQGKFSFRRALSGSGHVEPTR